MSGDGRAKLLSLVALQARQLGAVAVHALYDVCADRLHLYAVDAAGGPSPLTPLPPDYPLAASAFSGFRDLADPALEAPYPPPGPESTGVHVLHLRGSAFAEVTYLRLSDTAELAVARLAEASSDEGFDESRDLGGLVDGDHKGS